jgi:hypothetical protein
LLFIQNTLAFEPLLMFSLWSSTCNVLSVHVCIYLCICFNLYGTTWQLIVAKLRRIKNRPNLVWFVLSWRPTVRSLNFFVEASCCKVFFRVIPYGYANICVCGEVPSVNIMVYGTMCPGQKLMCFVLREKAANVSVTHRHIPEIGTAV